MASVVGEEIGTGDMKPMSDGFHSHARLINMEYRGILQEFSDSFFDPGQVPGTLVHGGNHGCRAYRVSKEVRNHF